MPDPIDIDPDDFADIEARLRDLDEHDLDLAAPPPEVWASIERELATVPAPTNVVAIGSGRRPRWTIILSILRDCSADG